MKTIVAGGMPKICVPLTGHSLEKVRRELAYAREVGADMVEWRADLFCGPMQTPADQRAVFDGIQAAAGRLPLVVTLRSRAEGGKGWQAQAEMREDAAAGLGLIEAVTSGELPPAYVDAELGWGSDRCGWALRLAQGCGCGVILSSHNFAKTPANEDMLAILRAMRALGRAWPDVQVVPKLAVMPQSFEDTLRLMETVNRFVQEDGGPVIAMSMGGLGAVTRVAGESFGSALTFAAGLSSSAPGQLPALKLRAVMELLHAQL